MNGSSGTGGGRECPAQQALGFLEGFLAGPMCGRCFPCSLGSYEAQLRLEALAAGRGTAEDVAALERIAGLVLEGSMCRKGRDAARFLGEAVAAPGFAEHAAGVCAHRECLPLVSFSVDPGACTRCGACKEVCPDGAIDGEVRSAFRGGYPPFAIRDKRCGRCGACVSACVHGAILVSSSEAVVKGGVGDDR